MCTEPYVNKWRGLRVAFQVSWASEPVPHEAKVKPDRDLGWKHPEVRGLLYVTLHVLSVVVLSPELEVYFIPAQHLLTDPPFALRKSLHRSTLI